jgi:hypothetical protein
MNQTLRQLSYEIELQPGEQLTFPPSVVQAVGAGRWLVTVEPVPPGAMSIRNHAAFLNGYVAGDEGLYDGDSGR